MSLTIAYTQLPSGLKNFASMKPDFRMHCSEYQPNTPTYCGFYSDRRWLKAGQKGTIRPNLFGTLNIGCEKTECIGKARIGPIGGLNRAHNARKNASVLEQGSPRGTREFQQAYINLGEQVYKTTHPHL